MISAGLDLTNFIDQNLTWKRVTKGRNTPRRSRRPVSNNLSSDQSQQKKRTLKQLSVSESSESEKSEISVQGRGSSRMEHVPIKKRRFILRSPSPPPQSDVEQCNSDPQSNSNGRTEPEVAGTTLSTGSVSKKSVLDCNSENTATSFDGTLVSSEDFSGIAMLAAAANSAELGCTVGGDGKSKMSIVFKQESIESFDSATSTKENIDISRSAEVFEKDERRVKVEDCVVDLKTTSIQSMCLENSIEDAGRNHTREETNEPVVSTISGEKCTESYGLPVAEDSPSNLLLPIKGVEIVNKTTKKSCGQKNNRLHWDLNTVMEEWDQPLEDELIDSTMQSVEISQTSAINFREADNVEVSTPPKIPLATDSGDRFIAQPENKASLHCEGLTSVITACNKSGSSHTIDTASYGAIHLKTCKNVIVAEDKRHDTSPFDILIKVGEDSSRSISQTEASGIDCGDTVKVASFISQSVSTEFICADKCKVAGKNASISRKEVLIQANEASKLESMAEPCTPILNKQAMGIVVKKEIEENTCTLYASIHDNLMKSLPDITEVLIPVNTPEKCGGCDSRISSEVSSQVTENTENVTNVEKECDSHLEDGELRDSIGHSWEDNKGKNSETKQVDNVSDIRGILFKATTDDEPIIRKNLSTAIVKEAEYIKGKSPTLIACHVAQNKRDTKIEGDSKDCGKSDVEANKPDNEYDYEARRNSRSASSSGRELQFSDRSIYSMKRSRSSNFDGMHQTNGLDESMQINGFRKGSLNDELKKDVGEKIVGVQEDTPPKVYPPRVTYTSQSRYNPMRRGSPDNNSRNRYDKFSSGINRGFREGYRRPGMYAGGNSNSNGPTLNNFGKRQRSFSPVENRIDSHFQRNREKSRSRSRTRSPDFRSEARMGRTRLPYQQPERRVFNQRERFDNMGSPERFRSNNGMRPARFHDTSPDNKNPNFEVGDYRRKPQFLRINDKPRSRSSSCSPGVRMGGGGGMRPPYQPPHSDHIRGRRFNDNGGESQPGRMMPPRRFNDNDYNTGGDKFQRKPRNIFERIHPVRNYDVDKEEDNHSSQNFRRNDNNYIRGGGGGGGGDRRNVEGFRREERGNNNDRYNNNSGRMFNSGPPKQFRGMRDYGDDTLPRGVRP